ncbi:hypothetical protein F5Y04DRAFT_242961 [Hypomontagnella monticulosa]|nr:hypothetical protein F5Y04DRAFT_242961 [Hypomontagnella monticulosa]
MAQDWASQLSSDRHLQESETLQAIPAIREIIENGRTSSEVANNLASIYEPRIRSGSVDSPTSLWRVFCSAIDHFGGDEETLDRLVALLQCLAEIDVLDGNGAPVHSTMNGDTFWRQLPGFAIAFRDAITGELIRKRLLSRYLIRSNITYLGVPYVDMIKDDKEFEEESRRFYNLNVFQARWLVKVGQAGSQREWGSAVNYALWHLGDALDYGVANSPSGLRRTELWVPQAAQWILIAGDLVYRLCQDREKNTGEPATDKGLLDRAVDGFLFDGEEGFSMQRWAFWKERFAQISELDVKPHVSQLASSAARRMSEIESS